MLMEFLSSFWLFLTEQLFYFKTNVYDDSLYNIFFCKCFFVCKGISLKLIRGSVNAVFPCIILMISAHSSHVSFFWIPLIMLLMCKCHLCWFVLLSPQSVVVESCTRLTTASIIDIPCIMFVICTISINAEITFISNNCILSYMTII